jgi:hypothetical protein
MRLLWRSIQISAPEKRSHAKVWEVTCGSSTAQSPRLITARSKFNSSPQDQLFVYRWNRMNRKGQLCRVIARGTMNSAWVRFLDGFEAITSRNALKKFKPV